MSLQPEGEGEGEGEDNELYRVMGEVLRIRTVSSSLWFLDLRKISLDNGQFVHGVALEDAGEVLVTRRQDFTVNHVPITDTDVIQLKIHRPRKCHTEDGLVCHIMKQLLVGSIWAADGLLSSSTR